jgi:hypothetical protein
MTDPDVLAHVYNACDPATPASERYYVDCTDVRGGALFAVNLCAELSQTKGRIHSLFTGHIGCGKSSELKHLADQVNQPQPLPGRKRFFPVVVNMSEYLDEFDVSATDILLAIVAELADALRSREEIRLSDSYLLKRWDELKGYLTSDIEINEGEISVPWAKVKVQRLRVDPNARKRVRETLLPQTRSLIDEINLAFVRARIALQGSVPKDGGQPYTDFVLILDNLERVQRVGDNAPGDASQRALFVEGAPQLTALDAHVVFTIPLSLVRRDGNMLMQLYSKELFVLPMVKTEHRGRDHKPFAAGREKLMELLGRRMPAGRSLADVFETEALDFLIEYSAGHVRNLMMFARGSTLYASGRLPITLIVVQRAIAQTISVLEPSLRPHDWDLLAELELSDRQKWDSNSADQRRLLDNLCVMEYINGGDENPFQKATPWYAVNPALRVLDAFEDAVTALERQRATALARSLSSSIEAIG